MFKKPYTKEIRASLYKYFLYCIVYWKHHGFSIQTGGYLVTQRKRIRESRKSKNEKAKYAKEHEMCLVLKTHGYKVEHLSDKKVEGSYDITINGIPADLKRMQGCTNIEKKAKHSIKKQGARCIVFQFDNWNENFRAEINNIQRKGIHGYYFLTKDTSLLHEY